MVEESSTGEDSAAVSTPDELVPDLLADRDRPEDDALDVDCDAVADQATFCVTLLASETPSIAAVSLEDGAVCPLVETHLDARAVTSLGLIDGQLVACDAKRGEVVVLAPDTGAVTRTDVACAAATSWRDGVLVADPNQVLQGYDSLEELLSDTPAESLGIETTGGELTTHDDVLVTAESHTDKVDFVGLPDGADLGMVVTERAAGRLDGLALTDDGLIVTARDGRLTLHDHATGALVRELDVGAPIHGLSCNSAL